MKSLLFLLFPLFLVTGSSNSKVKDDYETFKGTVAKRKAQLVHHPNQEVSDYLFKIINNNIYSYWEGTPWDFYGKTREPKVGKIACGYFITNTLTDIGFKIDRIALAECISGDMIKVLCANIHSFNNFKKLKDFLDQQPSNSVFIVGLDFHTGYIVKDVKHTYFLHSNYINKLGVVKEPIENAKALINNKFFMIGSLTGNKKLLTNWTTSK